MSLPRVVICGRPNVGKSSLFNWLANKRIAITDAQAGVTRDSLTFAMQVGDRFIEIVDTGGIGHDDEDNLTAEIERQIFQAIHSADLILFVVDARDGLTAFDEQINDRLRVVNVPVIVVVNKCDSDRYALHGEEFHRLGREKMVKVSAKENIGEKDLGNALVRYLPQQASDEHLADDPTMLVAIVGRRNVGKSTFINTLAQEERMIVSEVAGTTRDSVDVRFELDGKAFVAIDTPGLRRRKMVNSNIDYYGLHRAQRSIRRADVVFLFFDAMQEISKLEKQLLEYIEEQYKPCVLVVNKWDLVPNHVATEEWADYLRANTPSQWQMPIAFITGQTGRNVKRLINHAQMLFGQTRSRLDTPALNKLVRAAVARNNPPFFNGRQGKIYYAAQVDIQPPTVVLFCNDPQTFSEPYRRYIQGVFRDQLDFGEVPIKILFRKRGESVGKPRPEAADEPVGVAPTTIRPRLKRAIHDLDERDASFTDEDAIAAAEAEGWAAGEIVDDEQFDDHGESHAE